MKYYAKLYTNDDWKCPNDIKELNAKGYKPVEIGHVSNFKLGNKIFFTLQESATVYGTYVISSDGEFAWSQRFAEAPFQIPEEGGTIQVEFA